MKLKKIELLKDLSDEEIQNLELFVQERKLSPWEILFREWDEANAIYFLEFWELEAFVERNWEEIVLWHIYSQEILWEMAIFWNFWKRTASVRAIMDSKILVMLDFSIKEISFKYPKLLEKIKEIIDRRMKENKTKINM